MEQNENMIDGVLNNAPSPGEVATCSRPSIQQRLEQFKAQAADRAETLPRRQKRHMEVER